MLIHWARLYPPLLAPWPHQMRLLHSLTIMSQANLPLHFRSALQLAQDIHDGRLTSREVTRHFLDRIARADKLHAFSAVFEERAMAQAELADQLLLAGIWLSPLHGVPIALKDSIQWAETPAEAGSLTRANRISSETSAAAKLLIGSGLVILGKTNMTEYAFGLSGQNATVGTARNPWDPVGHRAPGGSSSGAGVAVAAGLAPIALGGDTGGSVRAPATLNHLVGFKPSSGLISRAGCLPLSGTLDVLGPIARTVEDARALIAILARPDSADPITLATPVEVYQSLKLRADGSSKVLLVLDESAWPTCLAKDAQRVWDDTIYQLKQAGYHIRSWTPPPLLAMNQLADDNSLILSYEGFRHYGPLALDNAQPLWEVVRNRILAGGAIKEEAYRAAHERRRHAARLFAHCLGEFPALLMPACDQGAQVLDAADVVHSGLGKLLRPANFLGSPAIALPSGFDHAGMPIGVQMLAPALSDKALLDDAHEVAQVLRAEHRNPDLTEFGLL